MPEDLQRGDYPTAERSAHDIALERLRQERDALWTWLGGQAAVPHGARSPETLGHKRKWWRVQRIRATQQRRRREPRP